MDIYKNYNGQFNFPLSEKEIDEAILKAEREAAEKQHARKDDSAREMLRIEPKPRRNAGQRIMVISTRSARANNAEKSFIRTTLGRDFATPTAQKPISKPKKEISVMPQILHTFHQKVCKICGKPFWPSNGQEVLCSEECKTINRKQKQLAYYHRKQSG